MCELVLESVKQLGWPGLPAEMTAVTGEWSWGGGLTISISEPLWKFSVAFKLLYIHLVLTNMENSVVIFPFGSF